MSIVAATRHGKLVIGIMGSADASAGAAVVERARRLGQAVAGAGCSLDKQTGAVVLFDREPERLITRLVTYYREEHYLHPNCFEGAFPTSQARPGG